MAATVHTFIQCAAENYLLSFVSFKGSHIGKKIAEAIENIVETNNLQGKLSNIVTANASNMKKTKTLVNEFAQEVQDIQDDDDDDDGIHCRSNADNDNTVVLDDDSLWENLDADDEVFLNQVSYRNCVSRLACFAHTQQLVVKDGLDATGGTKGQNVKSFMRKWVKMSRLCHQSTNFKEEFEITFDKGRSIPDANATRWSSTHTQLKTIMSMDSNKLTDVLRHTSQEHLILSAKDSAMLKVLVEILEPFAEATELTQGDKYCTLRWVVPCVDGLFKCLTTFKQTCKYHAKVVQALLNSLSSRFDGLLISLHILDDEKNKNNGFGNWIYPLAALLDPSYGLVWLEIYLPCEDDIKQGLLERLRNMIVREATATCNRGRPNKNGSATK